MKTEHEVIDNFLDKDYFEELKKIVMSKEIPWYRSEVIPVVVVDPAPIHPFFCHLLFYKAYVNSEYYDKFGDVFWSKLKMKALLRMKLNLYSKTDTIEVHNRHRDFTYDHKGCLFSFNTCDGFTTLEDDTKIESVENRALLFNPSTYHSSSSTTNDDIRLNLNINYS